MKHKNLLIVWSCHSATIIVRCFLIEIHKQIYWLIYWSCHSLGNNILREGSWTSLVPADPTHKPPTTGDIVYFETSPSFCEVDPATGFRGVRGRECNATSDGLDGCELMCCGHGYKTERVSVRERCGCEFRWCCHVTCQTCARLKDRHTCLWIKRLVRLPSILWIGTRLSIKGIFRLACALRIGRRVCELKELADLDVS